MRSTYLFIAFIFSISIHVCCQSDSKANTWNEELLNSVITENIKQLEELLGKTKDVNIIVDTVDNYQYSLLGYACINNKKSIIEYLVNERDANINLAYKDEFYEYGILSIAVELGDSALLKQTLSFGSDVNEIYNENGCTPLSIAVKNNREAMAKQLLLHGANPDGAGNLGNEYITVPLIIAVENKNVQIVELLLQYGADPRQTDGQGDTPIEVASFMKLDKIYQILIKKVQ